MLLKRAAYFCMISFVLLCVLEANPISHLDPSSSAGQQALTTVLKGDALAEVSLYRQATEYYNEALTALSTQQQEDSLEDLQLLRSYVLYQLAHAYLKSDQSGLAISALTSLVSQNPLHAAERQIHYDAHYLLGMAYKHGHDDLAAKREFTLYIDDTPQTLRTHGEEASFQLGLLYFFEGDIAAASRIWKPLQTQTKNPRLQSLLDVYQARIALLNHQKEAAIAQLQALSKKAHTRFVQDEIDYLIGETYYELGNYSKATEILLKLLTSPHAKEEPWYAQAIDYLGQSSLKMGQSAGSTLSVQKEHLLRAKDTLNQLYMYHPSEKSALALGEALILLAEKFPQETYYQEANQLLTDAMLITSPQGRLQALLLRARGAPTRTEKESLYTELARLSPSKRDKIYALSQLETAEANKSALQLFQEIGSSEEEMQHTDELAYLQGVIASRLAFGPDQAAYGAIAEEAFTRAAESPQNIFADRALKQLGALYYQTGKFKEAEETYLRLAKEHSQSGLCAEGWFWSAVCAEKLKKDPSLIKERKQQVWENFPHSPYAPEAYLSMYTTAEYIQGGRSTIKHLQNFVAQFPSSPLVIEAHYLLGMDLKRDRKTAEGKWIRKKNLAEAIDAFQTVETQFSRFYQKGGIPDEQLNHFTKVRYQAALEKALANLAIANDSMGAKKKIFLEYAEGAFLTLKRELEDTQNFLAQILLQDAPISPLYEEALFGLAQTYLKEGKDLEAEKLLTSLLQKYESAQIARSYYLSRVWYELGSVALKKNQVRLALQAFKNAEAAAKGGLLSTDQRLDLWIQKSLCYRALGDYDQALLILSKTINDDAISSLRLKAMYLRAETYEMSGKPELARKQLEALAKKGGYWGKESNNKLEMSHGH